MPVLGIDLGGTNIRAATLTGSSLGEIHSVQVDKSNGRDGVIHQLVQLVQNFKDTSIEGIGVGVPSYVDISQGIVYDTVNLPGWDEVPLKTILEERFRVPVFINNDANCFALGEKYYGKGQSVHSLVGLTLGTGVGAGIIINGQLYAGRNCGAGEIGGLPYLDKDYEYYAGHSFFSSFYQTTSFDLFQRASWGDQDALNIFTAYGRHLGELIKLVLMTYDPEQIILGGSISKAWQYFREGMLASLGTTSFKQFVRNLKLDVSSLDNAGIYGAAHLVKASHSTSRTKNFYE